MAIWRVRYIVAEERDDEGRPINGFDWPVEVQAASEREARDAARYTIIREIDRSEQYRNRGLELVKYEREAVQL